MFTLFNYKKHLKLINSFKFTKEAFVSNEKIR